MTLCRRDIFSLNAGSSLRLDHRKGLLLFAFASGAFCTSFRTFSTVLRPAATAPVHSKAVKGPPNDMIPHSWQVLHPTAADQHDRVLLQVMTFPRNIGDHFLPVCQTHLSDFSQRRIRLFWRTGHYLHTHTAPL